MRRAIWKISNPYRKTKIKKLKNLEDFKDLTNESLSSRIIYFINDDNLLIEMLILTKFIKKLYTSIADLISKIIPVGFQTPTVSISKSVNGIKQQEFMNKSKEAILTQELIYIQTSPCIFNTHKLSTRIESS